MQLDLKLRSPFSQKICGRGLDSTGVKAGCSGSAACWACHNIASDYLPETRSVSGPLGPAVAALVAENRRAPYACSNGLRWIGRNFTRLRGGPIDVRDREVAGGSHDSSLLEVP